MARDKIDWIIAMTRHIADMEVSHMQGYDFEEEIKDSYEALKKYLEKL